MKALSAVSRIEYLLVKGACFLVFVSFLEVV